LVSNKCQRRRSFTQAAAVIRCQAANSVPQVQSEKEEASASSSRSSSQGGGRRRLPKGSSDCSSTDGTSSREDIRTLRIKKVTNPSSPLSPLEFCGCIRSRGFNPHSSLSRSSVDAMGLKMQKNVMFAGVLDAKECDLRMGLRCKKNVMFTWVLDAEECEVCMGLRCKRM
jgi:hypothetical protein